MLTVLSDTMYLSISCRKSTPPQNRHLLISNSKQSVGDFVGELTFYNSSINTFSEIKSHARTRDARSRALSLEKGLALDPFPRSIPSQNQFVSQFCGAVGSQGSKMRTRN